MGMIRKSYFILFISCLLLLSGCDFNTSNINLYDTKISEVKATPSDAFYLSQDGTLYSPGADSDASSFVLYKDQKRGIVAENVRAFDTMLGGGYYIDYNNNLFIWNRNDLPLYKYNKKTHSFLLEDVTFAKFSTNCMIYIDTDNRLLLIGEFNGEKHTIDAPKLLDTDVLTADILENLIMWSDLDGKIHSFGYNQNYNLSEIETKLNSKKIISIVLTREFCVFLDNNNLWFYGNYEKFLSNDNYKTSQYELKLLNQNIKKVSCSRESILALDMQGNVIIWGKCLMNGKENTESPEYTYCEDKQVADSAKNIFISGACICYVGKDGMSYIYHSGGWAGFYGNSSDDSYVGINREPVRWIKE